MTSNIEGQSLVQYGWVRVADGTYQRASDILEVPGTIVKPPDITYLLSLISEGGKRGQHEDP